MDNLGFSNRAMRFVSCGVFLGLSLWLAYPSVTAQKISSHSSAHRQLLLNNSYGRDQVKLQDNSFVDYLEELESEEEQTVGKWTYKDGTYVSPRLAEEYDKTGPCRIVLSKGKIQIVLSEAFPAGYKRKMVIPGYLSETEIKGRMNGKTFTITSPAQISNLLKKMDQGDFTIQCMFLDPDASHWGWYDFPIVTQLKQATKAYKAVN